MSPKVYIIVLCYNGVELTLGCLESIEKQDYSNLELCVVDNGSTDGTVTIVSQKFPRAQWVLNQENLGYAKGNNRGIEYAFDAGAEAVFLINNDTRLHETCVSNLINILQKNPQIGITGPMVYTWDGDRTISSAGGVVDWHMADAANVGMGEKDGGQFPRRSVDFINGCGIMVTRDVIQKVGGLDPKFFMYWEETAWCLRVKKAGFEVYFESAAVMEHKAPILSDELGPTTLYYMTRNRFLFFYRHAPAFMKSIALARALKGALRGIGENRKAGKTAHAKAMQSALLHAISGRWGYADPKIWLTNK